MKKHGDENRTIPAAPQPPYTPAQVLANLHQIRDMVDGDCGDRAQWIRFVCNDIAARGIAAESVDQNPSKP